jgi:hypothetical protein
MEAQRAALVGMIRAAFTEAKERGIKPSSIRHSVWFWPKRGWFIYNDRAVAYDLVEPLIRENVLVFKGYEDHQGEKMLRYVLAGGH